MTETRWRLDYPGNEGVRARLADLAQRDHLHPCLLFEGPPGLGKAAAARWLAAVINCAVEGARAPCQRCWSCKRIAEGNHPDVIEVGLDADKAAAIISVKQARDLISSLGLRPFHARRRFVIIDPADAMNGAAANALLKTFEEPPTDTGFVLVTHQPTALLATVRSRTQRVRFGPVAQPVLRAWLAEQGVADPVRIARLSEGCPRRALELDQGEATARAEARNALVLALTTPLEQMFSFSQSLTRGDRAAWTQRVERCLDALDELNRDALRIVSGHVGEDGLYTADLPELAECWAEALDVDGLRRVAEAVVIARADLDRYVNARLLVDNLMMAVATQLGRGRVALAEVVPAG